MKNEDRVTEAFNTLRKGVIQLIQNPTELEETMKHYGDFYEYNNYSPFNTMLLMFDTAIQKGRQFQMARGYRAWERDFNRKVNKGEKAMWILAPNKIKIPVYDEDTHEPVIDEKTGKQLTETVFKGFRPVPVFELCQTSGEPIERPTKNHEYKSLKDLKLQDFIDKCGVKVEFEDLLYSNGYTDGKKIVIGSHNNELASISTLFHELAHYHLHFDREGEEVKLYSDDSTNLKELEAEAVSFMVSSALGITNDYSKKYISNWNKEYGARVDEEFEDRSVKLLNEALSQITLFKDCTQTQSKNN